MSDVVKKDAKADEEVPQSDKKLEEVVRDASSVDKKHFQTLLKDAENKWKNKMDAATLKAKIKPETGLEYKSKSGAGTHTKNISSEAEKFSLAVSHKDLQLQQPVKAATKEKLHVTENNSDQTMAAGEESMQTQSQGITKNMAARPLSKKVGVADQKFQNSAPPSSERKIVSGKTTEEWKVSSDSTAPVDYLLDSLVVASKLFKRDKSPEHICQGLPLHNGYLTVALFQRAAQRCGLSSRLNRVSLKRLTSLTSPAVLLLRGKRACVLVGLNQLKGTAKVIYPETGQGTADISIERLARDYTGYALFLRVQYEFRDRSEDMSEAYQVRGHWFWGTIAHSWKIYRDVLLASLLINLFAVASPLFVMNVYDRVIPNQAMDTLWVLAIGVSTVFVFDMVMRLLRGYFIDLAGKKSDLLLSSSLFQHVLGIKLDAAPQSVGSFARSIQDFENIREFITSSSISVLVDLPFTLLLLAVIYMLGGNMVFPIIITIAIVLGYGFIVHYPLKHAVSQTVAASAEKNALLIEALSGLETIKAIQAESKLQLRWENVVSHISRWLVRTKALSSSVNVVANTLQQMLTVVLVVTGAYAIAEGNLSLGALIAVVMLAGRCLAPMMQVTVLITRYHQAKSALNALNGVMELPLEVDSNRQFTTRDKFRGDFRLKNLSFAYQLAEPDKAIPLLESINLQIKAGEKVAIIGRIGSGKSTLLKLMIGLLKPDNGSVLIDNIDSGQISPADIRRNIGSMLQDSFLFYGTLKDNLTMGLYHIADEKVLKIAELTGVMDFANAHPKGLEMQVGERGCYLSSGQRQTVALARALIKDPDILLLDEPCDAMDGYTELKIRYNLRAIARNKTLVMVTHKPTMLDIVDRIIVMDQGTIIADGPKQKIVAAMKAGKLHSSGA